jgi:hypothetical protein
MFVIREYQTSNDDVAELTNYQDFGPLASEAAAEAVLVEIGAEKGSFPAVYEDDERPADCMGWFTDTRSFTIEPLPVMRPVSEISQAAS